MAGWDVKVVLNWQINPNMAEFFIRNISPLFILRSNLYFRDTLKLQTQYPYVDSHSPPFQSFKVSAKSVKVFSLMVSATNLYLSTTVLHTQVSRFFCFNYCNISFNYVYHLFVQLPQSTLMCVAIGCSNPPSSLNIISASI